MSEKVLDKPLVEANAPTDRQTDRQTDRWIDTVILGNNRELIRRLPDKSVDVCLTSPVYNRIRNDTYALFNDVDDDYYGTLSDITDQMLRVTKKEVIVNIQMNLFNKIDVCKYVGRYANNMEGIVVWVKDNPQPANNPKDSTFSITNAYEFFFVMADGNGGKNGHEFRANHRIKNVIHTPVNSEHFSGHGAVMRRDVCDFFIENFTKQGDLCLDPYFGFGTTGLCCALKGRHYLGFEIVPEYRERALNRIANETNQQSIFDYIDRC